MVHEVFTCMARQLTGTHSSEGVRTVPIEFSMAAERLAELLAEATWENPYKLAAIGARNGIDVMMAFLTVFL